MNVLARVLQDVRSDLLDLGIRAALIGGIADRDLRSIFRSFR